MAEAAAFDQEEHMNCKYCGSKYTEFRSETAEAGKTTRTYYCQSCKKTFTDDTLQTPADGEWLMTFRRGRPSKSAISDFSVAEIYRTSSGSFEIRQQRGNTCSVVKRRPWLKVDGKIVNAPFYLEFSSLKSEFDSKGILFNVQEIELNPQLTQEALKNDAMKALHKKDHIFQIPEQRSPVLLNDVLAWLSDHLGGKVRKSSLPRVLCIAAVIILIIVFIASLMSITSSDKTPWKKYGVTEDEYMETVDFLDYLDDVYGE